MLGNWTARNPEPMMTIEAMTFLMEIELPPLGVSPSGGGKPCVGRARMPYAMVPFSLRRIHRGFSLSLCLCPWLCCRQKPAGKTQPTSTISGYFRFLVKLHVARFGLPRRGSGDANAYATANGDRVQDDITMRKKVRINMLSCSQYLYQLRLASIESIRSRTSTVDSDSERMYTLYAEKQIRDFT